MSYLTNFIFSSYQLYAIFCGFTYIYVDIERRIMKSFRYIKIYVYIINLICLILLIYYFYIQFRNIQEYVKYNVVMDYINTVLYLLRIIIFGGLMWQRLKIENFHKIWRISYFDKLLPLPADKTMKRILILNIFIIYLQAFDVLYRAAVIVKYTHWIFLKQFSILEIFIAMENYVLLHHSLQLYYIKRCFTSLNNQLKNQKYVEKLSNIYSKLYLLLQQMNIINSPSIFGVFVSQLLHISLNVRRIVEVIRHNFYWDIKELYRISLFSSNIIIYFLICNRVYRIFREIGETVKECGDKQENQEVYVL